MMFDYPFLRLAFREPDMLDINSSVEAAAEVARRASVIVTITGIGGGRLTGVTVRAGANDALTRAVAPIVLCALKTRCETSRSMRWPPAALADAATGRTQ
jgi:hypothetical protein